MTKGRRLHHHRGPKYLRFNLPSKAVEIYPDTRSTHGRKSYCVGPEWRYVEFPATVLMSHSLCCYATKNKQRKSIIFSRSSTLCVCQQEATVKTGFMPFLSVSMYPFQERVWRAAGTQGVRVAAAGNVLGACVRAVAVEGKLVGGDVCAVSHPKSPPNGICWTTTRFPSTSACQTLSVIVYHEHGILTSYILNKPVFTFLQFGTPNAIECSWEECSWNGPYLTSWIRLMAI